HVPEAVRAVLQKLMEKKPEHRYQTPGDVAAELAAVIKEPHRQSRALPRLASRATPTPPSRATPPPPTTAGPAVGDDPVAAVEPQAPNREPLGGAKPRRRLVKRRLALASIVIALVCGMLLAAVSTHYPEASPPLVLPKADDTVV